MLLLPNSRRWGRSNLKSGFEGERSRKKGNLLLFSI